jgi:hypothetical protein
VGLSQRKYAKHRQVSLSAVQKALRTGRIAVGADGTIDPEAADRAWTARTATKINGTAGRRGLATGVPLDPDAYHKARTAKLEAEAEREALELRVRKAELLERTVVVNEVFTVHQELRMGWQTWPARVGDQIAASLGVDPLTVVSVLEHHVEVELARLADVVLTLPSAPEASLS